MDLLADKLVLQEKTVHELNSQVRDQELQILRLLQQVDDLEKGKHDAESNFEEHKKKSEAAAKERQAQIEKYHDLPLLERSMEKREKGVTNLICPKIREGSGIEGEEN